MKKFKISRTQVASQNTKYNLQQPSTTSNLNVASSSTVNGISDTAQQQQPLQQCFSDKICFNFGKELYVYTYRGVKKVKLSIIHIRYSVLIFKNSHFKNI